MTTGTTTSTPPVRRAEAEDPRIERWTATDPTSGAVLGTVDASAAGTRLTDLARPGEVELGPATALRGDATLPALVTAVVERARARYAAGVVVDTTAWADGDRRRLEAVGFVGGDARGAAVRTLDLTLAEDGSPTRVLDNPAMASLNGHHARFAERRGEIVRYRTDVSVWTGVPERPTDADWDDIAALLGSGAVLGVRPTAALPDGWTTVESAGGVQMTGEAITGAPDPEAVELTPDDVPEVLELIARTRPGPFLPRTIELGRYLGIRRDGRLVAMAGERLHPPGWTEISAVCTDDAFRGQGLGRRLVLAVAHGIRERGETPLLHAAAGNTNAIRLYEHLGFRLRDRGASTFVRVP